MDEVRLELGRFLDFFLYKEVDYSWKTGKNCIEYKNILLNNARYNVYFDYYNGNVYINRYSSNEELIENRKGIDYSIVYSLIDDDFSLNATIKKLSSLNDGSLVEDKVGLHRKNNIIFKNFNDISVNHELYSGNRCYRGIIETDDKLKRTVFKIRVLNDNSLDNANVFFHSKTKHNNMRRKYEVSADDYLEFSGYTHFCFGADSYINIEYDNEYPDRQIEYLSKNINSASKELNNLLINFISFVGNNIKNGNYDYDRNDMKKIDTSGLLEFDSEVDSMIGEIIDDIPFKELDINRRLNETIPNRKTDAQVKDIKEMLTDDFVICDEPSFFPSYRKKRIERIKRKKNK